MNYLLKYSNDDFLVREVWIEPRYVKYSNARFTILQLKKCNICLLYTSPSPRD